MTTKFNDTFLDQLGSSPEVVAILESTAEKIAARARGTAEVDTGAYRDGIIVRTRQAAHRTVVEVAATDEKSMLLESFTGNLARAAGSVSRG